MKTIDPYAADQAARTRTAREVAELFATLAAQRPEVLDALHALLVALTAPPSATAAVPAPPPAPTDNDEPTTTDSATDPATDPTTDSKTWCCAEEQHPDLPITQMGVVEVKPKQLPAIPKRAAHVPDEKDKASLQALMGRFGGPAAESAGLGVPSAKPTLDLHEGRWSPESRTARSLARFARTQAKRMRSLRRARHEQRELPPTDGFLADACIEDWSSDAARIARLAPKQFREAERWYSLTAHALQEIAEWLEAHPSAELGGGLTPQALVERLECLAISQKGIFCWIERALGASVRCGVQESVFRTLRAWNSRECFGVYLPFGMHLQQSVTSDERELVERNLARFELEHAVDDDAPAATQSPANTDRPASHRAASVERFESVIEAFEAARESFGHDGVICFTERAEESAAASAFKRPDEVYEFFESLHGIAWYLRENDHAGQPLETLFLQRGFRKKPCTPGTMRRLHRFYHMRFEGEQIELSQHVTLGSRNQSTCLSIHWWHEKERGRFVVGHCGKHLPNSLT
jgi:hypothetical protein